MSASKEVGGTPPRRRTRWRAGGRSALRVASRLGGTVGLILWAVTLPGTAQISSRSSFTGTASARLVGVDVRLAPTIVFDPLFDGGQSVAQAQLDSLGTSRAFASTAYPGSTVLTLPGTLGTLTDGAIGSDQIPRYPLYVDSADPTKPSDHQTVGVYDLAADSSTVESRASATDGATRGAASVTLDPATGDVVARAETTIAAVRVTDQLTINGVRSLAEVRQSPSGELERTSAFEVSSLEILGQRVAITADGLSLIDQTLPIGDVLQQTLAPLLAALATQGTTIEVVPAEELPDGVSAAALRITTTAAPPPAVASGVDSITTTFTFGGNVASLSNQAVPGFSTAPPIAAPGTTPAPSASGSVGGPGPSTGPTASRPTPVGDTPTPGNAGTATADALIASVPTDISAVGFYPVLVAAGVALFGAARLFPQLARRSRT